MPRAEDQNNLDYVERVCAEFREIMSNNHRDTLENMNKANKGEHFVLHFLQEREGAVLPSELSAALGASTARISAVLGALEKKGQIHRDIDKTNRRNILVTITEAGRARAREEHQEMHRRMTRVFADMGEADAVEFVRLSRRFSALMQKHMPKGPHHCGGRHSPL